MGDGSEEAGGGMAVAWRRRYVMIEVELLCREDERSRCVASAFCSGGSECVVVEDGLGLLETDEGATCSGLVMCTNSSGPVEEVGCTCKFLYGKVVLLNITFLDT